VDHAASARRTRRQVVSGGGEIERWATALGRGAARRRVLPPVAWSRWSMPRRCRHGDDLRVGSRMDAGAAVIPKKVT
jgi:hypothetical protein